MDGKEGLLERPEEIFGADGYARYLDYGDGFKGIFIHVKINQILQILNICILLYVNYTSKIFFFF